MSIYPRLTAKSIESGIATNNCCDGVPGRRAPTTAQIRSLKKLAYESGDAVLAIMCEAALERSASIIDLFKHPIGELPCSRDEALAVTRDEAEEWIVDLLLASEAEAAS